MNDTLRPAATTTDSDFTLSIEDALNRYAGAGFPRTPRSIQRYCAKGHLESRRIETPFGEKYLITPESVTRHIAYINEVTPTTSRDMSRQTATSRDTEAGGRMLSGQSAGTTDHMLRQRVKPDDKSRHVATSSDAPANGPFVALLKSENDFLRGQIVVKDAQIKDLTERAKETNHLIAGLQRMLSPLLGSPNGDRPQRGDGTSGSPFSTGDHEPSR